jgi:hypothetical protein
MRGNWSAELVIFIVLMVFALFVGLPWLIQHLPPDHHELKDRSIGPGHVR